MRRDRPQAFMHGYYAAGRCTCSGWVRRRRRRRRRGRPTNFKATRSAHMCRCAQSACIRVIFTRQCTHRVCAINTNFYIAPAFTVLSRRKITKWSETSSLSDTNLQTTSAVSTISFR